MRQDDRSRRPVEKHAAGFLDRPVLVVLCVSLALGIVVLGALWFGFFAAERLMHSMPRQHVHLGRGRQAGL